jgi:hypothetical protein
MNLAVGEWEYEMDKWLITEMTEIFLFRVGKKFTRGTSQENVTLQKNNSPFIQGCFDVRNT